MAFWAGQAARVGQPALVANRPMLFGFRPTFGFKYRRSATYAYAYAYAYAPSQRNP